MNPSIIVPSAAGAASGSVIRPPARLGDARKNWMALAQVAGRLPGLQAGIQGAYDQIAALQNAKNVMLGMHPFKLYQLPSVLRVTPDPANDWLAFRVRAGRVLESDATGTDGSDSNPDDEGFLNTAADIYVPSNTLKFWFWLEIATGDTTTAVVRYGSDPTASSYTDGGHPSLNWTTTVPWTTFPKFDAPHLPIGWVDTQTNLSSNTAVVRQLLRTDVLWVYRETTVCVDGVEKKAGVVRTDYY